MSLVFPPRSLRAFLLWLLAARGKTEYLKNSSLAPTLSVPHFAPQKCDCIRIIRIVVLSNDGSLRGRGAWPQHWLLRSLVARLACFGCVGRDWSRRKFGYFVASLLVRDFAHCVRSSLYLILLFRIFGLIPFLKRDRL